MPKPFTPPKDPIFPVPSKTSTYTSSSEDEREVEKEVQKEVEGGGGGGRSVMDDIYNMEDDLISIFGEDYVRAPEDDSSFDD